MNYFELNKESWNRRALVHFESKFYDVEGFLSAKTSLREIELGELQDIEGRRMPHLQCHFGLDTLSWVRLGAECTGVDISTAAVEKAQLLSEKAKLPADFVCTDIYSYTRSSAKPFDIVFTSYGTICWLPDLDRWAKVISSNLEIGGTFYMGEFHPIHDLLAGHAYFGTAEPDVEDEDTYTENGSDEKITLATWAHPLS